MNVGIVSIWCNRGQATVSRHLRGVLEGLGHTTFVLARPTRARPAHTPLLSRTGIWGQDGITETQKYEIQEHEYHQWATRNNLDVIWFDQNYQFDQIQNLKNSGIITIGRFVWEQFKEEHLREATKAYDIIYSMTECERQRYAGWNYASPRIRYGCHPETEPLRRDSAGDSRDVTFLFPAAGNRKLVDLTISAFSQFAPDNARLIVKGHEVRRKLSVESTHQDKRISVNMDDLSFSAYHELIAGCDVLLAPSRWEGLGLHLYDALAHAKPTIAIDFAPVNEVISDESGLLVQAVQDGLTKSGLPAWRCTKQDLGKAILDICDPGKRQDLTAGARSQRSRLAWHHTVDDVNSLLEAIR